MFETPLDEDEDRAQWRFREAHGELLLGRLIRLTRAGYRVRFESDAGIFDLVHPSKNATPVMLWPDGQLVDSNPTAVQNGSRMIIGPKDEERFSLFISRVPPPSLVSKFLATSVGEVLWTASFWGAMYLIGSIGWAAVKWAWQLVSGHRTG